MKTTKFKLIKLEFWGISYNIIMEIRDIVFPMPETIWRKSDFEEELIWVPFPNYSFETIKSIYNDEEMERQEEFLRANQTHLQGSRSGNQLG